VRVFPCHDGTTVVQLLHCNKFPTLSKENTMNNFNAEQFAAASKANLDAVAGPRPLSPVSSAWSN
jgi:type IV pilus biogenesis protein CpaD/CtpE